MRQGYNQQILTDDGKFIGVSLGSDHCAEHEWGIKTIKDIFGLTPNKDKIGIDRYHTHKPDHGYNVSGFYDGKNYFGFYCVQKPWNGSEVAEPPNWSLKPEFYGDREYFSAWSENAFCFFIKKRGGSKNKDQQRKDRTFNKDMKANLLNLYDALMGGEAVIWLGGAGAFSNGGLCFAIADKIPQSVIDVWVESHTEQKRMSDYLQWSGIHEMLQKAGKKFFACSPSRIGAKNRFRFWLNPYDQQRYAYGWFTLGDLKKWCRNEGPIMDGPRR